MNVLSIMVDVNINVRTLLVVTHALVILDIVWLVMGNHVMVRVNVILLFDQIYYCWFSTKSHSDINECNSNNGGCSGTCHNTAGGYYCTCSTGYSLNNDQHGCTGKILYY